MIEAGVPSRRLILFAGGGPDWRPALSSGSATRIAGRPRASVNANWERDRMAGQAPATDPRSSSVIPRFMPQLVRSASGRGPLTIAVDRARNMAGSSPAAR